jgi:tripeptidyl-peptidase I
LANGIPTAFVDVGDNTQDGDDDGFLDIINVHVLLLASSVFTDSHPQALIAESAPPLVISTSYGFDTEASLSESLTVYVSQSF